MTREEAAYWIDELYGKANEQYDVLPVEMAIACDMAIEILKEPERKKGKWIANEDNDVISGTCSCCGWNAILLETYVIEMPFCPNCGAEMEVEEND